MMKMSKVLNDVKTYEKKMKREKGRHPKCNSENLQLLEKETFLELGSRCLP